MYQRMSTFFSCRYIFKKFVAIKIETRGIFWIRHNNHTSRLTIELLNTEVALFVVVAVIKM